MFSNPILVFLGLMIFGACVILAVDIILARKGLGIVNFRYLGAICLMILIVVIALIGFSNPQPALAAEPQIVVAETQPPEPATCIFTYPENIQPWCFFIEEAALKYNVDPFLIAAVITQESNGDQYAGETIQIIDGVEYHTSESGAVCLMQVMPSDGISANVMCQFGYCFADRPTASELVSDPGFCIDTGTEELKWNVDTWGSTYEGLRHYGPVCNFDVNPYCDPYYYADLVLGIYENIKP